jgi:NAD(P)-dependent dehydrogenase (short-subunit alcohol dehydrogenase family)
MTLNGRVALVTGAGRSVGFGIARALAAAGAAVAVNDLHPDRAEQAAADIAALSASPAVASPFDVTDHAAVLAAVAAIGEQLGPVDILVNNAGVPENGGAEPFASSKPESWMPYIQLNLLGSMYCVHAVLPGMIERGWGRVIQISSGASSVGLPIGMSVYGASKAGIEGLLRHVAVEVGPSGVTVNALALGLMENVAQMPDQQQLARMVRGIPVGRLGRGEEVGAAAAWLASEQGAFVTGQVIHLNGGSTFGR